jgi:hypothetical protein
VTAGPMQQIPEGAGRHAALTSIAGELRTSGLDAAAIYEALVPINPSVCAVPVSDGGLKHIAESVNRCAVPEPEPQVPIGGKVAGALEMPPVPVDWLTRYMTEEAYQNVKPPESLIEGFLVKKSIAILTGPVAQRKSIIALDIAHALCTGEPLFFGCLHMGPHLTSDPALAQCRYVLIARIAELQPVAFSSFSRIWITAAFKSSCEGDSESSHLKLCLYHSRVDGETFERN